MPIRWSAVRVSEALDMIEGYVQQAAEPMEQAKVVAQAALEIPNLPQYISDCFYRLIGGVELAIGGGRMEQVGRLRATIEAARERIPAGAIEADHTGKIERMF